MKKQYLGDILDHAKGALLEACEDLSETSIGVLPMITDALWADNDPAWAVYEWLLRRTPEQIVNRSFSFAFSDGMSREAWLERRREYFVNAARSEGDLFLDPNTGLSPPSIERSFSRGAPVRVLRQRGETMDHDYVHRRELLLLTESNDRIVVVYQHSSRKGNYIEISLERLREEQYSELSSFGYFGTNVSLLFVSRSTGRLAMLRDGLSDKLYDGPAGNVRIVT